MLKYVNKPKTLFVFIPVIKFSFIKMIDLPKNPHCRKKITFQQEKLLVYPICFINKVLIIFWILRANLSPTDACSRPLCYTLKVLAYKKRQKHEEKKNPPPQKKIVYLFSMQLFSAVATMFSKKISYKKLKKPPSKVAHNRPKPFISQSSPAHSAKPRFDFSYHKMSGTSICSLICAITCRILIEYRRDKGHCAPNH